jgi:thioredoxin 1
MTKTPRRRPWRAWAALISIALVAPACGGSSPAGPSAPTPTPSPAPAPTTSAVVALTASNFADVVLSGRNVCMVEFFSPTCPHCQAMEPIIERLAADFRGRAVVGKLNVDTEPALVTEWGIRGWPTFVIAKGGRELSRQLGTTTYDELARMLNAALAAP